MCDIGQFKADLLKLDTSAIVQAYICGEDCALLPQGQHSKLKVRVAGKFQTPLESIIVVGSGKLGFSIAPGKRYRPFGDSSDIDVAIISSGAFERIWHELFDYARSGAYWEKQQEFEHYCFRGWIRPDKLPRSSTYPFTKQWWDFFQALTSSNEFGPYKITGALYHGRHFFDAYQRQCVDQCKQEMEQENANIRH